MQLWPPCSLRHLLPVRGFEITIACLKHCQGLRRNLLQDKPPHQELKISTEEKNLQQEGANSKPNGGKAGSYILVRHLSITGSYHSLIPFMWWHMAANTTVKVWMCRNTSLLSSIIVNMRLIWETATRSTTLSLGAMVLNREEQGFGPCLGYWFSISQKEVFIVGWALLLVYSQLNSNTLVFLAPWISNVFLYCSKECNIKGGWPPLR